MLVSIADAVRVPAQREQRPSVLRVLQEGTLRALRLLEAPQSGAREPGSTTQPKTSGASATITSRTHPGSVIFLHHCREFARVVIKCGRCLINFVREEIVLIIGVSTLQQDLLSAQVRHILKNGAHCAHTLYTVHNFPNSANRCTREHRERYSMHI